MAKKRLLIADRGPLVANLKLERVDLKDIGNRRFMFNPNTLTLFLGDEGRTDTSSHAQELSETGITENYDDFVRGWIGYGGRYTHGIIHFAPGICETTFDKGYDTLVAFADQIGIDGKTQVRNFVKYDECPICSLLPARF